MIRGFVLKGIPEVRDNIRKSKAAVARGYERGGLKAGRWILVESNKICPIDKGDLRESAVVDKHGSGMDTEVRVTYTVHYAIYVHENLEAYHEPPTQAKFLERTINENQDTVQRIIQDEVRKEVRKSGKRTLHGVFKSFLR